MPNDLLLSPRLRAIYEELLPAYPVWDLCCDHGLLGLACYQSQRFPEVHFVDQVKEIIASLTGRFQQSIQSADNPTAVFFYPRSAQRIEGELRGNLVVAGVGARTIVEILKALSGRNQIQSQRLILCPQNYERELVEFMKREFGSYFQYLHHRSLVEKGRPRTILVYQSPLAPHSK